MQAGDAVDRLDVVMVATGLADSRSQAQKLIKAGKVKVNGTMITKPSAMVRLADLSNDTAGEQAAIDADKGDDYVSRGAYKLVGAFDLFADDGLTEPQGLNCLDIGASTGGFTQVLLRRGAGQVIALDVGHGQLNARVAEDERVIEMSGVNIRDVHAEDLPFAPQLVVSDVSFISLTYVIPVIARIAAPGAQVVLLVKPQFEVGREGLGKHGIVTDDAKRQRALQTVVECAQSHGFTVKATAESPIEGTHGNVEYLLFAQA